MKEGCLEIDLLDRGDFPIEKGTAEGFYCSHVLEHIDEASSLHCLSQAHEKCKSGGFIRIVVPDTDLAYEALKAKDQASFTGSQNGPQCILTLD